MQAIEFEATAHNHFIRIPDTAPDGIPLRVLLLVDEAAENIFPKNDDSKTLLSSTPEVGGDEDFLHPKSENVMDELAITKKISPITQSLIGLLANAKLDETDYKKHLEDKYL